LFTDLPIQELLAALYLTRLEPKDLLNELSETFGKKTYARVWVFYAGITELKQVSIENALEMHKLKVPLKQNNVEL